MDLVHIHYSIDSWFPGSGFGFRNFLGMASLSRATSHYPGADQKFQVRYWFSHTQNSGSCGRGCGSPIVL